MSKEREQLFQQVFDAMNTTQRLMKAQFHLMFRQLSISPAQAHLLVVVQDTQPISLKDLAAKLYMTPGAVTQFVDALEKLGYLERTGQAEDRRIVCISLSKRGMDVMKRINAWRDKMMTNIVATFDDNELTVLAHLQQKIKQYMEENICSETQKGENHGK
jgi:DNA-binding MarR family transcriptional regulator